MTDFLHSVDEARCPMTRVHFGNTAQGKKWDIHYEIQRLAIFALHAAHPELCCHRLLPVAAAE